MESKNIKKHYQTFNDKIQNKRYQSPYPLRRYVHWSRLKCLLGHFKKGDTVLEVGCGDGVLAVEAAKLGFMVTATDISLPNLVRARALADQNGVGQRINFVEADTEQLNFSDNTFDLVIASHILEHLPNFTRGLKEVYRVTKSRALIALPTILNPCSMIIVGGGHWWYPSKRGFLGLFIGLIKTLFGIIRTKDGIEEGSYSGQDLPHPWRYPWVMKEELKAVGFKILLFEPDSLPLPFFSSSLPLIKFFDRHRGHRLLRNFGYGSHAVVEKLAEAKK